MSNIIYKYMILFNISKKKVKSLMIIYGKQVCLYAFNKHPEKIEKIFITKKSVLPPNILKKFGPKIKFIENKWAQSMSKGGNHQGIILEIEEYPEYSLCDIKSGDFIIVMDTITDAGNIGAIVRTAYALGVDGIVACGVNSLNFSAVARTSAGALLDMPIVIEKNILNIMNDLKMDGFGLYGAAMDGVPLEETSFSKRRVLVLGSEDRGISTRATAKLDKTVSITMRREFDSLNVSAAAAILIYRMGYAVE